MMEPPKERPHGDPQGLGERVSMHLESRRQMHGRLWNAWSQRHVRTASVVMQYPCVQQAPQVALSEWYQQIQALPPERADEPLAERIGLRTLGRRFEDPEPKVPYALVELLGENAVAIMQQKTVTMVSRDGFTQLLQRPVRRRVCRHIAMHNTAGRVFHQDKDVE